MILWTIGHSTLPAPDFLALLRDRGIEVLVDVRRYPASRRHPQFDGAALEKSLGHAGIRYVHVPALGGRRDPQPGSPNTGWGEGGFRGYADYMASPAFIAALAGVVDEAASRRCALMCAEKDWRHCHRGLIADALKAAGHEVLHIVDAALDEAHPYTKPARLVDGKLTYAPDRPAQGSLDF